MHFAFAPVGASSIKQAGRSLLNTINMMKAYAYAKNTPASSSSARIRRIAFEMKRTVMLPSKHAATPLNMLHLMTKSLRNCRKAIEAANAAGAGLAIQTLQGFAAQASLAIKKKSRNTVPAKPILREAE
jgi:hypothetical protein